MNTKRYQLENYRKYLLNRVTATPHFIEYIENCLATEDDSAYHSFHKIMIHNWMGNDRSLFETLAEYFSSPSFIPVNFTSQGAITSFYTCSLNLVLKITKLDFMFPHQRNMYNVDILFNDKTSADCFENRVTIEDIVTGVVSNRFSDKFDLDLTDFCNDPEFLEKKIHFYKLQLLTHFKILMLRMGRDTKSLNLSNNNLTQVPTDILNFFIKGDLVSINFSNNEIPSLQELQRVSSKIERLWLEGNPLCEEVDAMTYVKDITKKFPRLSELDGIKLNEYGFPLPFFKNFLVTPNKKTEMLVEKFLCLYFSNYDTYPRKGMCHFYHTEAKFTLCSNFTEEHAMRDETLAPYVNQCRNSLNAKKRPDSLFDRKIFRGNQNVGAVLAGLPRAQHDPASFMVDVLHHDKKWIIITVDGVYREMKNSKKNPYKYFNFRRTFVFTIIPKTSNKTEYLIQQEMFNVTSASKELAEKSFKCPTRSTNQLALHAPEAEERDAISSIFSHITGLRTEEAQQRLAAHNYDMQAALKIFLAELKDNKISPDKFMMVTEEAEDEFSDTSLLDDEID